MGIALPKSTIALTVLFGAMKARAAYVPVDWAGPVDRVKAILQDCGVCVLFLDGSRPELAGGDRTVVWVGGGMGFDWEAVLEHDPLNADIGDRRSDDLAYILYTSGSTGVPKGVMLTHRNATSFVDWCSSVFLPTEDDRFSSHAPFHFDLSILDIYVSIKHGASVHLIPDELGKSPKNLARFIASRRITVWYSTPSILSLLAEFGDLDRGDFSNLRLVLFAGEVFPVKQLRRLVSCWPGPDYYNLYGPTETNVCTFARIPAPIPEDRTEPYPIGWACSHCSAMVDSEGLLHIAGPAVFSGYWGRTDETGGNAWYNTGDVVREDDVHGFVYVGRRDRMIKRRGYRIELDEVESCLYRHPAISGVAVIAVPDSTAGVRIVACLAVPGESRPSIVEMKTFCHQYLPAYMSPDVFIFMDDLPRTSTNKVDYQSLVRGLQPSA